MKTFHALYEDGRLQFPGGEPPRGRGEVVVTFVNEPDEPEQESAGRRFVRRWRGILRGRDVENWRDRKADDLQGKPA